MKLSFKLLDSNSDITKKILDEIKNHLSVVMRKSVSSIQDQIRNTTKESLVSQPEYQSLVSGQLKYEFGIPTPEYVNSIVNLWIKNIYTEYNSPSIFGSSVRGGFSLSAIKEDYSDVLSSESAIIIDSKSGAALPWLEWLLLYGGKIIVRDYMVKMGPNRSSRTGMAIMVESKGSNWRVPPEFAGTLNNNWITRAIDQIDDKFLDIIQTEIEKNL